MWYLIFQIAFFISVSSFTSVGAGDTVSACIPGTNNNDTSCVCGASAEALGMENGTIPDRNINASSVYRSSQKFKHGVAYGRLNFHTKGGAGAWSADTKDQNQWLQVDFGTAMVVTGVATQGRHDYAQWVTSYSLSYSLDGKTFHCYQNNKNFTANTDSNTVVNHTLPTTIVARYVRIHPRTWSKHISMRAEFYGCKKPVSCLNSTDKSSQPTDRETAVYNVRIPEQGHSAACRQFLNVSCSNSSDKSSQPTATTTAIYNNTTPEPGYSAACRQFKKDLPFIFFFIVLAFFQFY